MKKMTATTIKRMTVAAAIIASTMMASTSIAHSNEYDEDLCEVVVNQNKELQISLNLANKLIAFDGGRGGCWLMPQFMEDIQNVKRYCELKTNKEIADMKLLEKVSAKTFRLCEVKGLIDYDTAYSRVAETRKSNLRNGLY